MSMFRRQQRRPGGTAQLPVPTVEAAPAGSSFLDAYRPKSQSKADIAKCVRDGKEQVADLRAWISQDEAERPALLRTATDEEIFARDKQRDIAKIRVEQLEILLQDLQTDLKAAAEAEEVGKLNGLTDALSAETAELAEEFQKEFAIHALPIVHLLERERDLAARWEQLRQQLEIASFGHGLKGLKPLPGSVVNIFVGPLAVGQGYLLVGDCVRLPSLEGLPVMFNGTPVCGHPSQALWWNPHRQLPIQNTALHVAAILGPEPKPLAVTREIREFFASRQGG